MITSQGTGPTYPFPIQAKPILLLITVVPPAAR